MPRILKTAVKGAAGILGLEIRRKQRGAARASSEGCLRSARANGLAPGTVFDVGAATGTPQLYEAFPEAKHFLIEPLEELRARLETVAEGLRDAECVFAAAMPESAEVVLRVHPDLVGSSVYLENEDSDVNGYERVVPAISLDDLCSQKRPPTPYLIKVDTQGSELDVLKGATRALEDTVFVTLEASLFEFFRGGPQIGSCITFMKDRGFVPYDCFGLQYRLLDGAMSQLDLAFVREAGQFRRVHAYATREQRSEQNQRLGRTLKL